MPAKILIAGEGGQGIQAIAKIITSSAQKAGKNVSYLPSFGVEQRGGVSLAYVQIGLNKINYPRFSKANLIIAFSNRSIESIKSFISDDSLLIYDNSMINNKVLEKIKNSIKNYLTIKASSIAKEKYSIRVSNMIMLGAISNQIKDVSEVEFEKAIIREFEVKAKKNPKINDLNLGAFREGINIAQSFDQSKNNFSGMVEKNIIREFKNDKISWKRFPEYCKGCSLCIIRCPVHALKFSEDLNFLGTQMPIVDMEKCIGCGICQQICPDGAIKVEKNK